VDVVLWIALHGYFVQLDLLGAVDRKDKFAFGLFKELCLIYGNIYTFGQAFETDRAVAFLLAVTTDKGLLHYDFLRTWVDF